MTLAPLLVRRAARLTGISEKTALVRMGVEALPARESARRLARLGAGRGIGWVDAHLLASARLSAASLWTLDRRPSRIASALALAFEV